MMFTMFFRDENGKEVKVADLVASNIIHKVIFVCPKDGYLHDIGAVILKECFEAAGVTALVHNSPMLVYQLKPLEEQEPTAQTL